MHINEKAIEDWMKTAIPAYQFMDASVDSVSDGLFACTIPLTENTGNHIKTFHAAFQWAAAEMLGGLVVLTKRSSEQFVPVVRSFEIEFLRPATTDIRAEAHFSAEEVEKMNTAMETDGRYDFDIDVVIKNIHGDVVTKGRGAYAVRIMK